MQLQRDISPNPINEDDAANQSQYQGYLFAAREHQYRDSEKGTLSPYSVSECGSASWVWFRNTVLVFYFRAMTDVILYLFIYYYFHSFGFAF